MTKSSKYILIIGLVFIVITYVLFYTPLGSILFGTNGGYNQVDVPSVSFLPADGQSASILSNSKETAKIKKIYYKAYISRDPFSVSFNYEKIISSSTESDAKEKEEPKILVLQGIFNMPSGEKVALIDDKVVSVNQRVSGWTVVKIYSDKVLVKKGGLRKTLRLKLGVE